MHTLIIEVLNDPRLPKILADAAVTHYLKPLDIVEGLKRDQTYCLPTGAVLQVVEDLKGHRAICVTGSAPEGEDLWPYLVAGRTAEFAIVVDDRIVEYRHEMFEAATVARYHRRTAGYECYVTSLRTGEDACYWEKVGERWYNRGSRAAVQERDRWLNSYDCPPLEREIAA